MVDLREAPSKHGMTVRPILNMVNHETNELFFDNLESRENLIGAGGRASRHPGRPERRAHADRRRVHRRRLLVHRPRDQLRRDRQVFGRPIGQNQGVQFPIADAFIEVRPPT